MQVCILTAMHIFESISCFCATSTHMSQSQGQDCYSRSHSAMVEREESRSFCHNASKLRKSKEFAVKQYPEEDIRRALGNRIGLTEQQVQVCFVQKRPIAHTSNSFRFKNAICFVSTAVIVKSSHLCTGMVLSQAAEGQEGPGGGSSASRHPTTTCG